MANDRYSRTAIRRKARKPRHTRSRTPLLLAIFAIVLVFGLGIFLTVRQRNADAKAAPKPNVDHWHAYLGVNICGTWIDNAPQYELQGSANGVHSHGDGLIHLHPYDESTSGKKATVGRFIKGGGWSLSGSSMKLWDNVEHKNGQDCPAGANYAALTASTTTTASTASTAPGEPTTESTAPASTTTSTIPSTALPAYIVWTVNGKVMTGNPANYRPKNGDIIAIGFLPKGVALVEPPGAKKALTNITDVPQVSPAPSVVVTAGTEPAPQPKT